MAGLVGVFQATLNCPVDASRLGYTRSLDECPETSSIDRETFDATIRAFKQRAPYRPFTVSLIST
jgi:hypothetical protein